MRPRELVDRLPGDRLRQRLPSVWEPADETDEPTALDEPDLEIPEPEEPEGREDDEGEESRLPKLLLGVSVGSGLLAVGAAVAARRLGRDEDDEEPAVKEPQPVERDEGTAAMVGLGFALVVEAIRRRLSSPTK